MASNSLRKSAAVGSPLCGERSAVSTVASSGNASLMSITSSGSSSVGGKAASRAADIASASRLRAPLMVKPCSYSSSRMRRMSSTSWCW
ncbi:hypothetical protein FSC37_07700 [Piscinibacter aquaticus]|uniref:Uncharacterized protein n=1 Tax=Piscinibacter aquaticus TaxID=392597 RepID=A0A5C6TZ65_9BURK|nr:hypothetical protein FSC37_07700 [Piscinibacter aquaticus]